MKIFPIRRKAPYAEFQNPERKKKVTIFRGNGETPAEPTWGDRRHVMEVCAGRMQATRTKPQRKRSADRKTFPPWEIKSPIFPGA